tara:strand:- start:752 stop:1123 length:372 start_codon:yes stop_codon:yes gene_type:complete
MKYFAKLDLNNKVIAVTHVGENNAPTEEAGIQYLNNFYSHSSWKEYKQDGSIRKNIAEIGMIYDESKDAFLWLENNTGWASSVFNEEKCIWEHPIPHPGDHHIYHWDEDTLSWISGLGPGGRS